MKLRVGQTLRSAVDATALLVVRCPDQELTVTCGGLAMLEEQPSGRLPAGQDGPGVQLGKRYTADAIGLELLCVKAGEYRVAVDGAPVAPKSAKPLPASD